MFSQTLKTLKLSVSMCDYVHIYVLWHIKIKITLTWYTDSMTLT